MFSFFKRKKKSEAEQSSEESAVIHEISPLGEAHRPSEKIETEAAPIYRDEREVESEFIAEPLTVAEREAVAEDAATNPITRLVEDAVTPVHEELPEIEPHGVESQVDNPISHVAETAVESHDNVSATAEKIAEANADQTMLTEEARLNQFATTENEAKHSAETIIDQPIESVAAPVESAVEQPIEQPVAQPIETQAVITQPVEIQPIPSTAEQPVHVTADEPARLGWAARLKQGLTKSRNQMAKSLASVFGGGKIDEDLYEELETVLITSDMGIEATDYLMKDVRRRVSLKGLSDGHELRETLKESIYDLIKPLEKPLVIPDNGQPFVIMLAGINGAGKTTSIGKLAKYFQSQGKSVLLAAGDTFRAAAREQLQEWGERNGVTVISQATGDSAAVCFDAVEAAKARGIDIVLADTAGRLPTQLHLMEEIKKVKRVLQKAMSEAPHEIIVVLDANIGQNAVNQVKAFDDALGLTGLIVTKLDGTAKGGVLAALASNRPVPVRYIGVGESIDDLRPFSARAFVDALFD